MKASGQGQGQGQGQMTKKACVCVLFAGGLSLTEMQQTGHYVSSNELKVN